MDNKQEKRRRRRRKRRKMMREKEEEEEGWGREGARGRKEGGAGPLHSGQTC